MSHVITDYVARGLDAAKPVSPNIGAGETGFYWATDTLKLYGWTGAAWTQVNTGTGGTSIVQVKSVAAASHATGLTLGAAPTLGNLLVAIATDQASSPSIGAGWQMLQQASAANDGYGVAIKLAGAAESATQTPFSDAHQGTQTIFEVNNGAGGLITADLAFNNTAVAEVVKSTKATGGGGLVLGVFVNRSVTGPTSITGSGVTADAAGNTTGVGRAVATFHISGPTNGNNTVTANYATAQGGAFVAIAIG